MKLSEIRKAFKYNMEALEKNIIQIKATIQAAKKIEKELGDIDIPNVNLKDIPRLPVVSLPKDILEYLKEE